jgi:hypothetical protein
MISIEDGLAAFLAANAGISALVSTRVYKNKLPQTVTMPALTFQRIDGPRLLTHDTSGKTGTASPRFQFSAWGASYSSAKGVTDAVRAALNGYQGTMGTTDPVTVQGALIADERYNPWPDAGLEEIQSDYTIWHLEA